MKTLSRFFFVLTILSFMLVLTGCTTAWTGEASSIITLLWPAITMALEILSAFGVGISTGTMKAIQDWSQRATTGLQSVAGLIDQYNAAEATAQPGLLIEIQTGLNVIVSDLSGLLPQIKITNPATQAKIVAIFESIASEMQALVQVIPAIQGKVQSHEALQALITQVRSANQFKHEFNAKARTFGKEYQI